MDFADDIGARPGQVIAVAVVALAAEILGRKIVAVEAGAHRAVVDQDALGESGEIWRVVSFFHRRCLSLLGAAGSNHSAARSSQCGLFCATSATFLLRRQALICFSRSIAERTSSV